MWQSKNHLSYVKRNDGANNDDGTLSVFKNDNYYDQNVLITIIILAIIVDRTWLKMIFTHCQTTHTSHIVFTIRLYTTVADLTTHLLNYIFTYLFIYLLVLLVCILIYLSSVKFHFPQLKNGSVWWIHLIMGPGCWGSLGVLTVWKGGLTGNSTHWGMFIWVWGASFYSRGRGIWDWPKAMKARKGEEERKGCTDR